MVIKDMRKKQREREELNYAEYRAQVIEGMKQGKALTGEDGLLKPLIRDFVETALKAEMDEHLATEHALGLENRRNGSTSKPIRSECGEVEVSYSRDRAGTFEPITVKKRHYQLGAGFDDQIIELYAMSNSASDIRRHLDRMYGVEMSEARISAVVNSTWERVETWKNRPLPACLVVLFADAVHISVRRDGRMTKVAVYVLYGITVEGKREIIDIIVGQSAESATEWGRCFAKLKERGLEDVLYTCTDGLAGLREQIEQAFPLTHVQRCVVHKMRNCFSLIDEADRRTVLRQLKEVYTAVNEAEARRKLEDFQTYWKGKYDTVVNLWLKDWDDLMASMNLSTTLRKLLYTTNAIENLNREIRRVTKSKGGWVSDRALLIQLFLALERRKDSWNKSVRAWASIKRELAELHGERFTKHIF